MIRTLFYILDGVFSKKRHIVRCMPVVTEGMNVEAHPLVKKTRKRKRRNRVYFPLVEAPSPRSDPLHRRWTFYYWKDNEWDKVLNVATVGTIQEFWGIYNNLPPLSSLCKGNYALFQAGTPPEWEHPTNKGGGKWIWENPSANREKLDVLWRDLMLLVIGESLIQRSELVVGGTVHSRYSGDRLNLWMVPAVNDQLQLCGRALREKMNIGGSLHYKLHSDALVAKSAYKSRAFLKM